MIFKVIGVDRPRYRSRGEVNRVCRDAVGNNGTAQESFGIRQSVGAVRALLSPIVVSLVSILCAREVAAQTQQFAQFAVGTGTRLLTLLYSHLHGTGGLAVFSFAAQGQ